MEPVMIGLILLTALCVVIASVRRRLQKPGERFSPEIVKSCKGALSLFFPSDTRTNRALTAALILAIAGASLTIAYAMFVPDQSGQFTELYVLGPDRTFANQSRYFFVGEPQPIIVGVVNHERRDMPYTLLVSLDDGASRSTLHTQDIRLGHNETWENAISLATDRAGEGMKMTFALYKDGDMSAPYRDVYIRVDSEAIGEKFTGFDVLANNNTTLEATRFTLGGGKYFNVTVFNHEYRTVPYTIKVILIDAANTTTLYNEDYSLAHNQRLFKRIKVIPDRTGVNMDMRFLLYRDNDLTAAYAMKSLPATVRSPPPAPADPAAINATAPTDSG
jgi:uncharacterized membrane protein